MTSTVRLEPAASEFAAATAKPPFLFEIPPAKGRAAVDQVQAGPIEKPAVKIEDLAVPGGPKGEVSVHLFRPPHAATPSPVVLYTHGAGWVFGNAHTHDRLVREIATGVGATVVFPNYSLSPEAKYPTAIEESYAVLEWIGKEGARHGLDPKRIAVAGDSVGGNMAIALTLLAKKRRGPAIARQLLFYPVTDAAFDTPSYREFATGYFLRRDGMQWFWDQYTSDPKQRAESTASPLRAPIDELRGLPPALVITAEADVLRDEGEAYANRLREAGVPVAAVRFQGIIHDFVMLNALAGTNATRAAMTLANAWLREGLASATAPR